LAVPIGETELLKVDQECFRKLVADADDRVVGLVEGWLGQLGAVLSHVATPAIQVRAEGQARFSLNNGQTLQPEPGEIAWVQLQQGNVRWMGFQELTFNSATGTFPLSDAMWLEADGAVQLATETTTALRNPETLLGGLSQLHTQLLHCIDLLEQQERTEELQRLQEQERLNRQVTAEALGELASTLGSQEATFFLEGTPLLVATGAVGRSLGVTIRPPARSEEPKRVKEPLEAIVRASRLRMRRVLLRDNWW
jgi:ATP-binding cassette subfamily C protein